MTATVIYLHGAEAARPRGAEVLRFRVPVPDSAVEAFLVEAQHAYGGELCVVGDEHWLTIYRRVPARDDDPPHDQDVDA